MKIKCDCGCEAFVWWDDEKGDYSAPTDPAAYDPGKHLAAICDKCCKPWDSVDGDFDV